MFALDPLMIFLTSPGVNNLHEGFVFVFEPDGIAVDDNEDDDDGGNNIDLEEVACDMTGSDLLILRIARRRGRDGVRFRTGPRWRGEGGRCRAFELASRSFLLPVDGVNQMEVGGLIRWSNVSGVVLGGSGNPDYLSTRPTS